MKFVGDKFDVNNPERFSRTWIARQLRLEFKETFGKNWKFSVRKEPGNSNSIDIIVKKAPADAIKIGIHNGFSKPIIKDEYASKIYRMANAYNYDDSDGQTDYFDRNYYTYIDYQLEV